DLKIPSALTPPLSPPGSGSMKLSRAAEMKAAFEAAHKARFGFVDAAKEIVIEAVSVEAVGGGTTFDAPTLAVANTALPAPALASRFFANGAWQDAAVYT